MKGKKRVIDSANGNGYMDLDLVADLPIFAEVQINRSFKSLFKLPTTVVRYPFRSVSQKVKNRTWNSHKQAMSPRFSLYTPGAPLVCLSEHKAVSFQSRYF